MGRNYFQSPEPVVYDLDAADILTRMSLGTDHWIQVISTLRSFGGVLDNRYLIGDKSEKMGYRNADDVENPSEHCSAGKGAQDQLETQMGSRESSLNTLDIPQPLSLSADPLLNPPDDVYFFMKGQLRYVCTEFSLLSAGAHEKELTMCLLWKSTSQ